MNELRMFEEPILPKLRVAEVSNSTYRCGYCGTPTHEDGHTLSTEDCRKLTDDQLNNAILTHGYCCLSEFEPRERMRVTRDMAIDAGDLSLEGEYI